MELEASQWLGRQECVAVYPWAEPAVLSGGLYLLAFEKVVKTVDIHHLLR